MDEQTRDKLLKRINLKLNIGLALLAIILAVTCSASFELREVDYDDAGQPAFRETTPAPGASPAPSR